MNILVAVWRRMSRDIAAQALGKMHHLTFATNYQQAMSLIGVGEFDGILADLLLPEVEKPSEAWGECAREIFRLFQLGSLERLDDEWPPLGIAILIEAVRRDIKCLLVPDHNRELLFMLDVVLQDNHFHCYFRDLLTNSIDHWSPESWQRAAGWLFNENVHKEQAFGRPLVLEYGKDFRHLGPNKAK